MFSYTRYQFHFAAKLKPGIKKLHIWDEQD